MTDILQNSTIDTPSREKSVNLDKKNENNNSLNSHSQSDAQIQKEKFQNRKNDESIDISISSMQLDEDEEELIESLLKEEIDLINEEEKRNNNINLNNQRQNKNKSINESSEININKNKKETSDKFLNKKISLMKKKENNYISKEENLINQLLKNYSFNVLFQRCLNDNLDINKNLDKNIINLIKSVGYKQIFKLLLTKYGLLKPPKINKSINQYQIDEEEKNYPSEFNTRDSIIKIMDIKANKYKQNPKNNISKNNKGLGLHLHKNRNGEIYKYLVHRVDNGKGWYYCSDRNCRGVAILELNTKQFKITRRHTLKYNEHSFYIRILPNELSLFKYFKKIDKNEAQVIYKYDGDVYAVFY